MPKKLRVTGKRPGEDFWERLLVGIGDDKPFAWAGRIGIPKSTFSNCMRKGCVLPAKYLARIAENTGHSIDWLLTGNEDFEDRAPRRVPEDSIISEVAEDMKPLRQDIRIMVRDIVKRIAEEERPKKK